jgi:hypothetical protein
MRTLLRSWIVRAAALMFAASIAFAQDRVPFRQEELDQMLAPIALYPDSLLSQILMASTYPLEVVQAARWSKSNRGLKGEAAVKAVERMDWDPSVKSLTAFPEVLTMMDEKLDWTERLGEAFLAQQQDVMATLQDLRRRADARGNLQSNDRMRVTREPDHIAIEPPAREVVYVPYYNPTVVYGPWWYPAYPPVYWAPYPAYYAYPAYGPFFWGPAIGISAGFFFGHFDWHHGHTTVVNNYINNVNVNRRTVVNQSDAVARRTTWQHDPAHRRGIPFRTAEAREQARSSLDARRGGDRGDDGNRAERRADATRTADLRQTRLDERRSGSDDRAGSGRAPSNDNASRADRSKAGQAAAQPAVQPDGRRAVPDTRGAQPDARAAQPDSRGGQSDTRQARPDSRSQPDRSTPPGRSERPAPQGGDRRSDRTERGNNVTRFQARASDAPSWPSHVERRAQPYSGAHVPSAPQARHFGRESLSAPRASAGASAPRMHAEPRGGGGGREFNAGRGGGRS